MFEPAALKQMWANAWPVITILIASSIVSIAIIIERWLHLRGAEFHRHRLVKHVRKMLEERRREDARAYCESLRTPVGRVLGELLDLPPRSRGEDRQHLERLAERMIRSEAAELAQFVTGLGTIGSVAPFIGLFGTVVGIIHAFRAIAENAGGGPAVIANGIAEALVTTALGLFVAIPAIIGYNLFTRKIERITEEMELCVDEVIDIEMGGPRV